MNNINKNKKIVGELRVEFSLKGKMERDGFLVVNRWLGELAEEDECLTSVGRFEKKRLEIEVVREALRKRFSIIGKANIGVLEGHILIHFLLEDCSSILLRGQACVDGVVVRFGRWSPDWRRR